MDLISSCRCLPEHNQEPQVQPVFLFLLLVWNWKDNVHYLEFFSFFFSRAKECHASDGDFSSCLATTTAFPKSICLVLLTKKKCRTEDTGGFWCSACSQIPAETSSDHLCQLLSSEIKHMSSPVWTLSSNMWHMNKLLLSQKWWRTIWHFWLSLNWKRLAFYQSVVRDSNVTAMWNYEWAIM